MRSFTFRSHERLHRPEDFLRARRQGRKRVGRFLVLWMRSRGESPPRATRLGIVVSRKDGNAVHRNLFKRRVREAFRLNKQRLSRGWDLVVASKTGRPASSQAFPAGYQELLRDFLEQARPLLQDDKNSEKKIQ
ncbi:MAG: ribonuclease P protein component [Elusimicrobia bacterium]|nr:ribonuclease P protein component [Elusimicrobiota bacterium]